MPKINSRQRKNPDEMEVDAYAENGKVIICFGDDEITIDPEQAQQFAELVGSVAEEAAEEDVIEDEEEELEEEI